MALGCNNNKQMLQRIMLEDSNPIYEKELIPSLESQDDGIENRWYTSYGAGMIGFEGDEEVEDGYLFSARYNAAQGVAARTVLLSTILSMGTISLILIWITGGF